MKIPCFTVPVVQRNSHRWRFEATEKYCAEAKKGFSQQMGKDLWLMVSLVTISTIDLCDWLPASRAPGLFVLAPQSSWDNEGGQ